MVTMKRKDYMKPTMKIIEVRYRTMILAGSDRAIGGKLGGFRNDSGDAWDGSSSGGSSMGGWTDEGGSAWE